LEAAFWPTFLAVEKGMVAAGEIEYLRRKIKIPITPKVKINK
jgi:hypothetical protein